MAALANFAQILAGMKRPSAVTPPFVPGARPRVYSPGVVQVGGPPITPPALPGATPTGYPAEGAPPVLMGGVQPAAGGQGPLLPGMIGVRQEDVNQPQQGPVAAPSPATPPNSGSVWTRLLSGLRNPANQAAMVTAGAAMTAPRQFGQTSWGQFNQALAQAYGAKQGYLYNQQQAQKSAQQQAFENDIKKREAAVKEEEARARTTQAKAEETRSGAQAGLYGAQAKAIPDEIAIKRIEADTGKTNAQATLQHYQTMERDSSARLEILKTQEERLNKQLTELIRSNKADEATNAYRARTERSLGEVRNNIAQQRADNEKAKMVLSTEEGQRPLMIKALDIGLQTVKLEDAGGTAEEQSKRAQDIGLEIFRNTSARLPKRNPDLERKRLAGLEPGPGEIPAPTEGQPVARTTGPNPPRAGATPAAGPAGLGAAFNPTPGVAKLPAGVDPSTLPKFVGDGGKTLVQYQGQYYSM